jgi:hypothetical protein
VDLDQLRQLVNLVRLGLELALGDDGRGEGRGGEGEESDEDGLHFGGGRRLWIKVWVGDLSGEG